MKYSSYTEDEIIEEIKNLLIQMKNNDYNSVSLYEVADILGKKQHYFNKLIKNAERLLEQEMYFNFVDANVKFESFNFVLNQLRIKISLYDDIEDISIIVDEDKNISLSKANLDYFKMVLSNSLLYIYDSCMKFRDIALDSNYGINSTNSLFRVNIDSTLVEVFARKHSNNPIRDFELKYNVLYDKYKLGYNGEKINYLLDEASCTFFKKIYVNINDCPKWMQEELYKIRNDDFVRDEEMKREQIYHEVKQQKILEMKRKIFPWLKK